MSNSCAQIKVTGEGSAVPKNTVKFPGAYKKTDPAVNFSIWGGMKDYPLPGPAVYKAGGASGTNNSAPSTTTPVANPSPVQSAAPAKSSAPVAGAAAVHNDENCGGKKIASNSRVYRALRK